MKLYMFRPSYFSILTAGVFIASTTPAFARGDITFPFAIIALSVLLIILMFIPTYVAFSRHHPNRWLILVLNLAVGGTLVGWVAALVWALKFAHKSEQGSHGGESGLNLFINDPKIIRVEPAMNTSSVNAAVQMEQTLPQDLDILKRLKQLFLEGVITQIEYDDLRRPILEQFGA